MGLLFPQRAASDVAFEGDVIDDTPGEVGEEIGDDPISLANQYMPSSAGLSFVVPDALPVELTIRAARYEKSEDEEPSWHRRSLTGDDGSRHTLPKQPPGVMWRAAILDGRAEVTALWRSFGDNWLVTVAVVNAASSPVEGPIDNAACLAQVSLQCQVLGGTLLPYPAADRVPLDAEDEEMTFLFRDRPTFAIGHGCAAHWDSDERAWPSTVRTEFMPSQVVPDVVFDIEGFDDVLDLRHLAGIGHDDQVIGRLQEFVAAYSSWIDRTVASAGAPSRFADAVKRITERLRRAVQRMNEGIALLRDDPLVRRAFALGNEAMIMQMRHSRSDLGGTPKPLDKAELPPNLTYLDLEGYRWRPFQLAFLLLTLRSIADEKCADRNVVDLIWFPTGGGKTEAYLGVVAIQVLLRRLRHGDAGAGTTVITRYTLRLLTTQQFQRAATLTCALEVLRRRSDDELGSIPVSIGIWVGGTTSPNKYAEAAELLQLMKNGDRTAKGFQLESCPWCGCEIVPSRITDDDRYWGIVAHNADFQMHCPNNGCTFHMRLPVSVVDQHLYDNPPTFLIATVDKFAQMAWNERPGVFLGAGDFPGPSLIIQDELHLISGPLGTIAALYEGAFDIVMRKLSGRPKLIASTATIRRADQQVRGLFDREVFLFPPSGLTADNSYFVRFDRKRPGRQYVGVMAQSHTPMTANVHTAAALLQAPVDVKMADPERDSFWTLVAYHNSLRELGKTVTLLRDDIPARISVVAKAQDHARELDADDDLIELTSNVPSIQIPRNLERLKRQYGDPQCVSVVACTNMISVGVDVPRLGLMLVVGQPKSTSEYIQATSRVGRSGPGLVVTLYSSARPRDRSHYESFKPYHLTLYRQVEPTSVTPFALPARQRALHAALVVLARFLLGYRSNDDAAQFERNAQLNDVIDALTARVSAADDREAEAARRHLRQLADEWADKVAEGSAKGGLRYRARGKQHVALIQAFDERGDAWPTLHSMRNVDFECLIRVKGEDR
jgi:superfamily II DNA or RNA helicase